MFLSSVYVCTYIHTVLYSIPYDTYRYCTSTFSPSVALSTAFEGLISYRQQRGRKESENDGVMRTRDRGVRWARIPIQLDSRLTVPSRNQKRHHPQATSSSHSHRPPSHVNPIPLLTPRPKCYPSPAEKQPVQSPTGRLSHRAMQYPWPCLSTGPR